MKTIRCLVGRLVAGSVALAVAGLAVQGVAQDVKQLSARVIRVTGAARVSIDNGKTWLPVRSGDVLMPGSVVQTAEQSKVDLVLGEGSGFLAESAAGVQTISNTGGGAAPSEATANIIRIYESTMLGIDKLTSQQTGAGSVEETQLNLSAGRIMGNVKKLSAASRYEIKFPNGVAGIRGSGYDERSSGACLMYEGSMVESCLGPDGALKTVLCKKQQRFDPAVDKDPVDIPDNEFKEDRKEFDDFCHEGGHEERHDHDHDHTIHFRTPTDGDGDDGHGSSSSQSSG